MTFNKIIYGGNALQVSGQVLFFRTPEEIPFLRGGTSASAFLPRRRGEAGGKRARVRGRKCRAGRSFAPAALFTPYREGRAGDLTEPAEVPLPGAATRQGCAGRGRRPRRKGRPNFAEEEGRLRRGGRKKGPQLVLFGREVRLG